MQSEIEASPDKKQNPLVSFIRKSVRTVRILKLRIMCRRKVVFGCNAYIGKAADLYVPDFASVGDNVSIGGYFLSQVNFEIGSESLISSHVSFVGHDHDLNLNPESAYSSGRLPPSKVILEGNNFVGYGATIVGNVRVGYGSVIGAGSLVLKDIPPGVVVGGVPARILKRRDEL